MPRQIPVETDRDGMTLRGTAYLPDGSRRHPAALLLHGLAGDRMETGFLFVRLGRALATAGIAAVSFDFLHSGESDGRFEQMTVESEIADAMTLSRWLIGQPFADRSRLGLVGFSLGGLVAGCVTGQTDLYSAVTLIAPTTVENLARHMENERGPDGRVLLGAHILGKDFFEGLPDIDPLDGIATHPRPTLIVQGGADETVKPDVSGAFADVMQQANVPCRTHTIAGAGHTFGRPDHQRQLIEAVSEFLADQLKP